MNTKYTHMMHIRVYIYIYTHTYCTCIRICVCYVCVYIYIYIYVCGCSPSCLVRRYLRIISKLKRLTWVYMQDKVPYLNLYWSYLRISGRILRWAVSSMNLRYNGDTAQVSEVTHLVNFLTKSWDEVGSMISLR